MKCKICDSHAINHHLHGRDGSDGDLCDVCYWMKRCTLYVVKVGNLYIKRDKRFPSLTGDPVDARRYASMGFAEAAARQAAERGKFTKAPKAVKISALELR